MLDFNQTGQQHILVTDGHACYATPRARTWNMRQSFDSVKGLTIVAVLLLCCSPEFVQKWPVDLASRWWIGQPVDVVAVRRSRMPGKYDAVIVVNRRAGEWMRFAGAMGEFLPGP